jgi:hypothetical protein
MTPVKVTPVKLSAKGVSGGDADITAGKFVFDDAYVGSTPESREKAFQRSSPASPEVSKLSFAFETQTFAERESAIAERKEVTQSCDDSSGGGASGEQLVATATDTGTTRHARSRIVPSFGGQSRAAAFRDWLTTTYADVLFTADARVLDVGGSKGQLAFALRNVHGVDVTVIDPRPLDLDRCVERYADGRYDRQRARHSARTGGVVSPQRLAVCLPRYMQCLFDARLLDAYRMRSRGDAHDGGDTIDATGALYDAVCADNTRVRWTKEGLMTFDKARDDVVADDTRHVLTWDAAFATLNEATLLIGMYPDQATASIIEFATMRGIPFAVIPCGCCIKSTQIPTNASSSTTPASQPATAPAPFMHDGKAVETYDEFLDYLISLGGGSERVKRASLPDSAGIHTRAKRVILYTR